MAGFKYTIPRQYKYTIFNFNHSVKLSKHWWKTLYQVKKGTAWDKTNQKYSVSNVKSANKLTLKVPY